MAAAAKVEEKRILSMYSLDYLKQKLGGIYKINNEEDWGSVLVQQETSG